MKFSQGFSLLVGSLPLAAHAFQVPTSRSIASTRLPVLADPTTSTVVVNGIAEEVKAVPAPAASSRQVIEPGRYDGTTQSITLPWLPRPQALDGSHAGDYGFDPLGFSESMDLYSMQEAELRHGRLAMLAVVGWPTSELIGPKFLLQDGKAPSVLNGFGHSYGISLLGVLAIFGAIGFFEFKTSLRRTSGTALGDLHRKDMEKVWQYGIAGDYNFDPLSYYSSLGEDCNGRKGLREVEVTQGRYAMIGITLFAMFEAITGTPIVENNMFFHPNALLPVLAVSYFAWSQIYEVSDITKYPIQIQYTKDGEQMLFGLKDNMKKMSQDTDVSTQSVSEGLGKAGDAINSIKTKIQEMQDSI